MISIIIPAYNEAGRIATQLAALSEQTGGGDCEVVVADNGSTDATVQVASEWADRMPVRVVDASARRGVAAVRNTAVAQARGDLLVFVDADDVVFPGFVDAWRGLAGDVGFATGPVIHFDADAPPPPTAEHAPRRLATQLGFLPYAVGANFAVRRAWFERSGGFLEDYPLSEDVEMSWRLQLMGAELVFVPGAVVAKRRAPSLAATLRQYYRYGFGDPFLYRDYRAHGAPPPAFGPTIRSYLGLVARIPLLWRAESRRAWAHQLARRAGRLVGSVRAGVCYP